MTLPLATRLKWQTFTLLEAISDLRGNVAAGRFQLVPDREAKPALWVFVSTIGEVNATAPFLTRLAERYADLQLVLITDHPHYIDAYLERYPQAVVCVTRGHRHDAHRLAERHPPRMLVVAEIPCLPHDAPCRFSFAFVLEAKRCGAPACIVNGWLYHYQPNSRMDTIERWLFTSAYLASFDLICVQLDETRDELIAAGAPAERCHVTGNIKFDAMDRRDWQPEQARSPQLLRSLLDAQRPIVVAGCVTDYAEQELVLDAFVALREAHPDAFIVIAPRHPEYTERMVKLEQFLAARGIAARFRSQWPDQPVPPELQCLVLDTMGELRDFYAASTVAHVGVDHNLLEPLAFEKPITCSPGWEATYPSFPVYCQVKQTGVLGEAPSSGDLALAWRSSVETGVSPSSAAPVRSAIDRSRGAVQRDLALIEQLAASG